MTTPGGVAGAAGTVRAAVGPIAVIGVFGVTLGVTYPLFTAVLEQRGISSGVAGLNGAMTPLGMVLAAPAVPRMVQRVSPWAAMVGASVGMSALLAALAVVDDLAAWFVLRFLIGFCAVAMFVLSETWISEVAAGPRRGRLLTAYTSVLALGFAVGPAVMAAAGADPTLPFLVAVACPLAALVPLWVTRKQVPRMAGSGPVPVRTLLDTLSVLLLAVLAVSVFDSVTLQFLPSYGRAEGLSPELAALSLSVLLLGQVVFQYPLGWLADRIGTIRALVLSLSAGAAGAFVLALGVADRPWLLWPLVALWGGLAFAGYPLVLTLLGEGLPGVDLLRGNAAFAVVWGLGGIIGPPYSGAAIDVLGPVGMPLSLASLWVLALALLVGARWRTGRSSRT